MTAKPVKPADKDLGETHKQLQKACSTGLLGLLVLLLGSLTELALSGFPGVSLLPSLTIVSLALWLIFATTGALGALLYRDLKLLGIVGGLNLCAGAQTLLGVCTLAYYG